MTKDEALKMALEALENTDRSKLFELERNAIAAIREALAQPDTDMAYTIALQRAIEWHCDGKAVPPDVAELCPYHAEKLNTALAEPEPWTPEDMAYRPGGLAQPEPVAWHTEDHLTDRSATTYSKDMVYRWECKDWPITPLYTAPPKRQPLTDGEMYTAYITATDQTLRPQDERLAFAFARAIEAAHGIGDKK